MPTPDSSVRSAAVLGRMAVAIVGPWILLFGCEWDHYRRLIQWTSLPLTSWDRWVLMSILVAKTTWPLLLLLAASALLGRWGRGRLAAALWRVGASGVFLWVGVDLSVQQLTNNHLFTYVAFLADPRAWQWGGGAAGLIGKSIAAAGLVGAGATLVDRFAERVASRCLMRWPRLAQRPAMAACWLAAVLAPLGALPAHRMVSCQLAVERLHATLPWDPLASLVEGHCGDGAAERIRVELNGRLQASLQRRIAALRDAGPVDERAVALRQSPHVVVFILESLRHDLWSQRMMPRIAAWAEQGLLLERHYAGGNCSHLGVFGLLYARSALVFHSTLDAGTPPQACATLHAAGYECSYLASSTVDWLRMNEYIRRGPFDHIITDERNDWVAGDRAILAKVREQLRQATRPQFVVCFLDSTHLPYLYPPEFEVHQPAAPADGVQSSHIQDRVAVNNRYLNAALFLDHEVAETIATLDPSRHLIVVTGDHGESIYDDGTLSHGGKLSETQCRTPLAIVGPGVPQRRIAEATTHADVLPTLLHVLAARKTRLAHTHGRDVLSDALDDQALIATMKHDRPLVQESFWDAMLLDGDRRLSLRISLREMIVRSLGYLDRDGRFEPRQSADGEEADRWATLVDEHLERLAGRAEILAEFAPSRTLR